MSLIYKDVEAFTLIKDEYGFSTCGGEIAAYKTKNGQIYIDSNFEYLVSWSEVTGINNENLSMKEKVEEFNIKYLWNLDYGIRIIPSSNTYNKWK